MTYNIIKGILPNFCFVGRFVQAQEVTSGNVNNTYLLRYRDARGDNLYTLQRINTYVFKNPDEVMRNIAMVTDHLRASLIRTLGTAERRVLELIRTQTGEALYRDESGGVWRAYTYISNAHALDMVETPEAMEEVGRGFGRFQRLLYDFPAEQLFHSIPNFHHTIKRFYAFVRAVDEDKAGRVAGLEEEIEFMFDRRRMMGEIVRLLDAQVIPLRVTHNDTKSNNVLLDEETGKAICVIDLDTVMPGSVLYDYGDAIRFGASTAAEDEPDVSRIRLDMDKAKAFTRGFIEETAGFLTNEELLRLPLGIKVITCELAMRFLTDYIDGDLYFKVNSPDHNLVRARAQMTLLKDVERREEELQAMTERYLNRASSC
ncbi:MAG: aminoglycoside phosphotransferase family protein [Clostridiales bacterium]|jgi:Ser/Thr protein kinase RdoA (MazF antagonist)|nr:aminoglycoside phosphotransferase family protein [Clostridiales bacterium]